MLLDQDKVYKIYHTILGIGMTLAVLLFVNEHYHLRVPTLLCGIISILSGVIIHVIDVNKKNPITYLILLSIIPVVAIYFWIRDIGSLEWFNGFYDWILRYDWTEELYVQSYAFFAIMALGIIASALFYILLKNFLVRAALSVVILCLLLLSSVKKIEVQKIIVGISIFYIMNVLVEVSSRLYNKKAGLRGKKDSVIYLMVICLLLAVVSTSFPSKKEPIQWTRVRKVYSNIRDQINDWQLEWDIFRGRKQEEFALSITGYSEQDTTLGNGEVAKDDGIALWVSRETDSKPVYLVGSVSNIYTGVGWEKSRADYIKGQEEYRLDYIEMVYGISRMDPEILMKENVVRKRNLSVIYNNISTITFFYPLKSSWFDQDGISTETANITFPARVGKDTSSYYTSFEMNLKGEVFQKMLMNLNDFTYEDEHDVNVDRIKELEENDFGYQRAASILEDEEFYHLLKERAEMIQREYLNVPESLPDRVWELADEITKEYSTDYEKLKAIESYLRGYAYTLTPGGIQEGADFVDDFLFEKVEGYCTSFASAMAVLGRCAGIPTRYVEGFVAKYDEQSTYRMSPVRNRSAHAWAEAYIEGFGWVPFEATPPLYGSRYISWIDREDQEGSHGGYDQTPITPHEPINDIDNTAGDKDDSRLEESWADEIWLWIVISITILMVFVVLLIIYYILLKRRYKKAFSKASYSKKAYILFLRILGILKKERVQREPYETILDLSNRIGKVYEYSEVTFEDVAKIFMNYRYGEEELSEDEYKQMHLFHQGLMEDRKSRVKRLKFIVEDFVLLRETMWRAEQ